MNNNVERIRDALAGAILGAVISVVIFLLSILNTTLHVVGGLFTGGASFEAMSGGTFANVIIVFMLLGTGLGYGLGYYATQESNIKKNVQKWMAKHNK
jgi:ABC-type Na+ efflux pump permease subunit